MQPRLFWDSYDREWVIENDVDFYDVDHSEESEDEGYDDHGGYHWNDYDDDKDELPGAPGGPSGAGPSGPSGPSGPPGGGAGGAAEKKETKETKASSRCAKLRNQNIREWGEFWGVDPTAITLLAPLFATHSVEAFVEPEERNFGAFTSAQNDGINRAMKNEKKLLEYLKTFPTRFSNDTFSPTESLEDFWRMYNLHPNILNDLKSDAGMTSVTDLLDSIPTGNSEIDAKSRNTLKELTKGAFFPALNKVVKAIASEKFIRALC